MSAAGRLCRLALLALPLALGAGLPRHDVAAEEMPCDLEGRASLSRKLVCPLEPVQVVLSVRVHCPAGAGAAIRSVRASLPLPTGLVRGESPTQSGGGDGDRLQWELALEPAAARIVARDGITLTHAVTPLSEGTFRIGEDARVQLDDDVGRTAVGTVEPVVLSVGHCPRPTARVVYLPLAVRQSCRPDEAAVDIVLVIDRSSSMGRDGIVEAARRAGAFLDELDLGLQRVGVVAFDQRAEIVAPVGSGRPEILRALEGLRLGPGTRLERGLRSGVAALEAAPGREPRRRVIALVSDGVPTGPGGRTAAIEAARDIRLRGIEVVSLALGPAPDRQLLAALGSGSEVAATAARPEGLPEAYRTLAFAAACGR